MPPQLGTEGGGEGTTDRRRGEGRGPRAGEEGRVGEGRRGEHGREKRVWRGEDTEKGGRGGGSLAHHYFRGRRYESRHHRPAPPRLQTTARPPPQPLTQRRPCYKHPAFPLAVKMPSSSYTSPVGCLIPLRWRGRRVDNIIKRRKTFFLSFRMYWR